MDAKTLPLRATGISCQAGAGIARVVLAQTFANPHAEALHVTYTFSLPAESAVGGFRFRIGDKVIVGDIDKKQAARERFEEAVLAGQTAAILEEDRSSLFSQEIGNVPPGAEVVVEIALDMKLHWLDEGMWEWRFPLAAAPRYLGACGRVADAKKIAFDVAESMPVRASRSMHVADAITNGRSPESPSHPLSCVAGANGCAVELGGGNAATLDRDVVVQWSVSSGKIGISCEVAGPREGRLGDAHALVTIVPPHESAHATPVKRDVTFLLDTSGSMGGAPIEQAKRIVLAMLDGLGDDDRFEMIEFSNSPRRFQRGLAHATKMEKAGAAAWVR
ncbi:MAG: VIT domain-containing protein, partial [Polyangiaceae bacterium]